MISILLAAVLVASPAPANERPATNSNPQAAASAPAVGLGLGPGFSFNGGPTMLRLGLRGGLTLMHLDSKLELQMYLPLSMAFASTNAGTGGSSSVTTSIWGFEVLPSARLVGSVIPKLSAYGDLGLGLVLYQVSTQAPIVGTLTGTAAGLGVRLGAGLDYALTEHLSVVLEPIGLLFNMASNVTYNVGGTTVTTNSGSGAQWVIWIGAKAPSRFAG